MRASFGEADWPFDPAGRFALAGPGDVRRAETWLLRGLIKRMLGSGVHLYDPSRPVARRVRQLLRERDALAANPKPTYGFYTTGDADVFKRVASRLLRTPVRDAEHVEI